MPNFGEIPNLFKIKDTTKKIISKISLDATYGWIDIFVKSLTRKLHIVLSWIDLSAFFHIHKTYYYFVESPKVDGSRSEFTVNSGDYELKIPGSTELYINGLRNFVDQDFEETETGIILIGDSIVKAVQDIIWCHFQTFTSYEELKQNGN